MTSSTVPTDGTSQFIRLVSADKHVYILEKKVAQVSGLIRSMLSSPDFKESKGEIEFPEISTAVLGKIIEYMHFKVKYNNSKVPVPEFVVPPDSALEILRAASYLDC